jgi:hypothetical protein
MLRLELVLKLLIVKVSFIVKGRVRFGYNISVRVMLMIRVGLLLGSGSC